MANTRKFDQPAIYRIQVKGCLEEKWSDWFHGFDITTQDGDVTMLVGPVADQAALHGLLAKIRDLCLPLLLMERVENQE
jgi:hypothetical protein